MSTRRGRVNKPHSMGRPGEPPSGHHQQTKPIFPRAKSSRQSTPIMIKKFKQEIEKELSLDLESWATSRGRWRRRRKRSEGSNITKTGTNQESEEAAREKRRGQREIIRGREICRQKLAVSPPESS